MVRYRYIFNINGKIINYIKGRKFFRDFSLLKRILLWEKKTILYFLNLSFGVSMWCFIIFSTLKYFYMVLIDFCDGFVSKVEVGRWLTNGTNLHDLSSKPEKPGIEE